MKNIKTKVYSCRLNAEQIRNAEMVAAKEGDKNIGALLKRLLIEQIKRQNDFEEKTDKNFSLEERLSAGKQFAALDNVRQLITMSFELLFEATNSIEIYESKKISIEKKWNEIQSSLSASPPSLLLRSEDEIFQEVQDDEIEFNDLFSGETFRQISEDVSLEKQTSDSFRNW